MAARREIAARHARRSGGMILFSFFGSLMLAGIVAVLFERWGWSHNGIVPSVLITFGAVLVLYFLRMSFRIQPAPVARPNRCQLFGPGSRPAIFEKMAASAADVINLDLEDRSRPTTRTAARANMRSPAINDVDWGKKTCRVRINGLDTPYWYRDVVDLLEQASDRLDQIMIPKVGNAADIYAVDALVTAIEAAKGRTKPLGFEVIIETAAGIAHVEEIAAASPRLQAMSLGAADFAASMGMQTTGIGGTQENYYMLQRARNTGPIPGTGRRPPSSPPAAPTACCRWTAPSATSPTTRASAPRRALGHAGHGRQMGDPPQAGGAGQRGLHPVRGRRAEAREILAAMEAGQGRGRGRHGLQGPAGRHRLDQAGRGDREASPR
jgi:malyl-CoA/(S)-citramalyl-CoA lyase